MFFVKITNQAKEKKNASYAMRFLSSGEIFHCMYELGVHEFVSSVHVLPYDLFGVGT